MEIARFFLDLLFPIECLGCGKEETFMQYLRFGRVTTKRFVYLWREIYQ